MENVTRIIPFRARGADTGSNGPKSRSIRLGKHSAGLYDLIIEQSDLLVDAMLALVGYMKDRDPRSAANLKAIWKRCAALRKYHLDMLACSPIHPAEFNRVSRISVTLDLAIDHARSIALELLELSVPADQFMLKMVENTLKLVRALNKALYKLATNPVQIEEDIRAALYEKYLIEKTYRLALATLGREHEISGYTRPDIKQDQDPSTIHTLVERRMIYHSVFKSCKRLSWIISQIREITARQHPMR
ncbi:MAG: hypothetical protein H6964_01780 [Chromatiaceae bacterium]|nr:hypothetical protein [Gammaproteobacteria bacterium]MCB1862314.1 hypothetical protein [Gammaproteobacteria bacterium]MCB1870906.1 hypothetical protein [Gammaproteobacteria bacterium]MCB1881816.1 hypothetical protein [Gammaproteobacteria bacterium]MCP5445710.1 hypothetical protein [Chromatiaceae bacterium]